MPALEKRLGPEQEPGVLRQQAGAGEGHEEQHVAARAGPVRCP